MLYNERVRYPYERRIGMDNNNQMNFEQNRQPAENIPVNPYSYQPEDVQVQNAPPQGEPRFDPYTGKPLNVQPQKPEPRFDPYTGQPLNPQPQYVPPIYTAQPQYAEPTKLEEMNTSEKKKGAIVALVFGAVSAALAYVALMFIGTASLSYELMDVAAVFGLFAAIPGIVFGALGKKNAKKLLAFKDLPLRGCALAGRIAGLVGMICSIVFTVVCAILMTGTTSLM